MCAPVGAAHQRLWWGDLLRGIERTPDDRGLEAAAEIGLP